MSITGCWSDAPKPAPSRGVPMLAAVGSAANSKTAVRKNKYSSAMANADCRRAFGSAAGQNRKPRAVMPSIHAQSSSEPDCPTHSAESE